jgi:GTPase SAR1 family protein
MSTSTGVARSRIDLNAVRATLRELYEGLRDVTEEIIDDHKKLGVCSGYSQFQKDLPTAWLERASDRMRRTNYKIAFVGPFKAGKSTFLSALLEQPGLLPAEDAECTFSVGVVAAPPPGEPEHVKVSYFSPEESLRNILSHTRYAKVFEEDRKTHSDILREFTTDRAIEFIRDSAEKHASSDLQQEADELKNFVEAYKRFRDRLGKTHVDSIEELPQYVRKEEGIGHLLLIKIVEIYRNNPVIKKQNFQIADTPGTDSMNEAARTITLNYLKEADAVVYLAEARGLSENFDRIRKELNKYHNEIREKMFIVANKADWYEVRSMRKNGAEKAPIEIVFQNIVDPLRAMGLNEKRLYFTCGRFSELNQKLDNGNISPEENQQLATIRKALEDKRNALDSTLNPVLLNKLTDCFGDGGMQTFRHDLVDYLEYDIQVERLKEIYFDLNRVHTALNQLLDPEQGRLKDILALLKPRSQQITEFFEQAKTRFLDQVSRFFNEERTPVAIGNLMAKAWEKMDANIVEKIDRLNLDGFRAKLAVPTPFNVKMEVIQYLKHDLSDTYVQTIREAVSPVFRSKLMDQVKESRVGDVLKHLSDGFGSEFSITFENLLDSFNRGLDHFTRMRTSEETWDVLDAEMKPAGFETEWSDKVADEFRADMKNVFTERYMQYTEKLKKTLSRHYLEFIRYLFIDMEKTLDEVSAAIRKDPDRVDLPVKLLTGRDEENEDERKQRCLLSYFRQFEAVKSVYEDVSPKFTEAK